MNFEQFILLNDLQKQKEVSAHGMFLGYDEEKGIACDIYALFEFFVEFNYNIYKKEGIIITACHNLEDLPTLAKIIGLNE